VGGVQVCGEYQVSFCGGLAYAGVSDNSTAMPTAGQCLYIGDFEQIEPDAANAGGSAIVINGVETACSGNVWANCKICDADKCTESSTTRKPDKKDGGYYVYVKSGAINGYTPGGQSSPNGWRGIAAKAKPDCTIPTTPSSSSGGGATSILNSPLITPESPLDEKTYYTIQGTPLGSTPPQKPGVYIVKQGHSIKKIVVK
jgi:hypothetical protein